MYICIIYIHINYSISFYGLCLDSGALISIIPTPITGTCSLGVLEASEPLLESPKPGLVYMIWLAKTPKP